MSDAAAVSPRKMSRAATMACMSGGERIVDGLILKRALVICQSGQADTLQRVSIVVASTLVDQRIVEPAVELVAQNIL